MSDRPQLIEAEVVEPNSQISAAPQCRACGCPREPGARFCVACGLPFEVPTESGLIASQGISGSATADIHTFRCDNCGSEVATNQDERSYTCPFCDSTYVVEIKSGSSERQRPEFVIGFSVTREQAQAKFFEWLGRNSFFRPGDLVSKATSDKQRGVYLPFWHFSMTAASRWSATIGEYWYRTETYTTRDSKGNTITQTRQVQETEWWPLAGQHRRYYFGYLVSASRGMPQAEALAIQPYQLTALVRFRPFYLAGWLNEEYSVPASDAVEVAESEFRSRQEREVESFMPGDTHRDLRVDTELTVGGSDLILLPVHVLSYRYRDRVYRFLVNGQTGKVVGRKPWSTARISAFVILVVVVVTVIVLVSLWFSNSSR